MGMGLGLETLKIPIYRGAGSVRTQAAHRSFLGPNRLWPLLNEGPEEGSTAVKGPPMPAQNRATTARKCPHTPVRGSRACGVRMRVGVRTFAMATGSPGESSVSACHSEIVSKSETTFG